jgi:uncharacterized protein YlxW (UPF0749 family)
MTDQRHDGHDHDHDDQTSAGPPADAADEPTVAMRRPPAVDQDEATTAPDPAPDRDPAPDPDPDPDPDPAPDPAPEAARRPDEAPAAEPDPTAAPDDPGEPDDGAQAGAPPGADPDEPPVSPEVVIPAAGRTAPWRRLSSAGALIWVLLALFGFTLVVQLRSNDTDDGLAGARQDDLVRILSDLEARDTRLQSEIAALEGSRQQLTSGVAGREAALAEADRRADELGLLAGTLPGRGAGLVIRVSGVKSSAILNAVQELRGAGGEVMQVTGSDGGSVRIVASTYFVDAEGGGIDVDGTRLNGPYTLTVIGVPQTMQTALEIPGGVVASVQSDGGSVTMEQRTSVEVTAVRKATSLQYARPVS